ncbi:MAG: ATP-binding protein [Chitinophagaceae bacterium]|nr:ATP-binding protein [Chitinophagaceae bacterium]
MINKSINDIAIDDFKSLKENGVAEGKTIEYKRDLKLLQDSDKKEFLYDVSSFANASGGDLIFGISENRENGLPEELTGISLTNFDEEIRKMESLIRDGIAPRLTGIEIRKYDIGNNKFILLIRIPKGWNSPHQVIFKGSDKFYARSTNGKYKLDIAELRNAFLLSESIVQRLQKFREDRIMKILANETSVVLQTNAKIMLQLVPLSTFQNHQRFDLASVSDNTVRLSPLGGGNREWRYNIEGILSYVSAPPYKVSDSYIQIFFNGVIETVNSNILAPYDGKYSIPVVEGFNYEKQIVKAVKEYLNFQEQIKIEIPILVFITLIGVKGYRIQTSGRYSRFDEDQKIDRDILQIPEIWINSYTSNIESTLKPGFDMIWNASGFERSYNYDEAGNWNPK